MPTARAFSVQLLGIDGQVVQAEADLDAASPRTGLLDRLAAAETTDRIRAAVRNADLPWPTRPVTLTTVPATPSSGLVGCDLAWACAVLAAAGVVPADRLDNIVLLDELSLDGHLRPVRGVLPALLAAQRAGLRQAVVPAAALPEAALVPGMHVWGADSLSDVVAWLRGQQGQLSRPGAAMTAPDPGGADLADVLGQPEAAVSVEIAAAGGHHLLLIGPPGAGATLLARCLPGLLPELSAEQALEVAAIHSVSGSPRRDAPLITRPPFHVPHHSISMAALVGGGVGRARPGAISLAHHGVLFLDELSEWGPARLDAVRAALDKGEIRLARRDGIARYPTRFQLVGASCPCPCAQPEPQCQCSPQARRRYLARLTGPLLDRIDLRVRLRPVVPFAATASAPEGSSVVRDRVLDARQRAAHRWAGNGATTNAAVPATVLQREFPLPRPVTVQLDRALAVGALTRRGAERAVRVAWTFPRRPRWPQDPWHRRDGCSAGVSRPPGLLSHLVLHATPAAELSRGDRGARPLLPSRPAGGRQRSVVR